MTLQLNHLNVYNNKSLPPTDSRFRPDQRALEFRQLELAAEEKNRLEEKQRQRRKENEQNKTDHRVLWFKKSQLQGETVFISNEKYWNEKVKANWKDCLDIY